MKFIINANPEDVESVARLLLSVIPTFERSCRGVGWGWMFRADNGKSYFVAKTKSGLSAKEPGP